LAQGTLLYGSVLPSIAMANREAAMPASYALECRSILHGLEKPTVEKWRADPLKVSYASLFGESKYEEIFLDAMLKAHLWRSSPLEVVVLTQRVYHAHTDLHIKSVHRQRRWALLKNQLDSRLITMAQALKVPVQPPARRIAFKEKFLSTSVSLFVYLVCCQSPLYGMIQSKSAELLYWMRMILASNCCTLMEFGISPIIASGMVLQLQLLAGSRIIDFDRTLKEDRMLYQDAQNLLALFITMGEAVAYVMSGMYGDLGQLGVSNATLIFTQLFFAGLVVSLLDELMSGGYGIGSAVFLFVATNLCESIIWKAFSPTTTNSPGKGTEFEGGVVAAFHFLATKTGKVQAVKKAFYWQSAPNLTHVIATVLVFVIVSCFQGFRVDLPITFQKVGVQQGSHPIKLFTPPTSPSSFKFDVPLAGAPIAFNWTSAGCQIISEAACLSTYPDVASSGGTAVPTQLMLPVRHGPGPAMTLWMRPPPHGGRFPSSEGSPRAASKFDIPLGVHLSFRTGLVLVVNCAFAYCRHPFCAC